MKTNIIINFDGTVDELIAWLPSVFKDGAMNVNAQLNSAGAGGPESKLIAVLRSKYNVQYTDFTLSECIKAAREHIKSNHIIGAIKEIRNGTQLGLKEAKDFVEEYLKQ